MYIRLCSHVSHFSRKKTKRVRSKGLESAFIYVDLKKKGQALFHPKSEEQTEGKILNICSR